MTLHLVINSFDKNWLEVYSEMPGATRNAEKIQLPNAQMLNV